MWISVLQLLPIGRRKINMPEVWRRLCKLDGNLVLTGLLPLQVAHSAFLNFPTSPMLNNKLFAVLDAHR